MTNLTEYGNLHFQGLSTSITNGRLILERQRQENIERNRELLAQFNLTEARHALNEGVPSPSAPQPEAVK